jgi:DNA-binding SARP family transcriptional activator
VQIGILGPLEVREGDRQVAVAGTRLRRLLTRLAADVGRTVSPGELVEAVWADESPVDVSNALQSLVSRLRRALGDASAILQLPGGYRLDLGSDALDSVRFEREAAVGRRDLRAGDAQGAEERLTAALALWRGMPFSDADDAGYAAALTARLDEIRLTALGDRVDARLVMGRAGEVIPELEELVSAHPLR